MKLFAVSFHRAAIRLPKTVFRRRLILRSVLSILTLLFTIQLLGAVASACPDASFIESAPYVPHVVLLKITYKHHPRLYDVNVQEVLRGPAIPQPIPQRLFIGETVNLSDLGIGSLWVMQVLKRTYDDELFLPDCYRFSAVIDGKVNIGKDKSLPDVLTLEQLKEELRKSSSIRGWW